ncbi:uncharacterized protein [Oscarella lobularis]|uniref:uncharacterized protein isoform X2 n=1 Tax=Oscarella lobularis TaxID=121494 RepID=UPI0033137FFB
MATIFYIPDDATGIRHSSLPDLNASFTSSSGFDPSRSSATGFPLVTLPLRDTNDASSPFVGGRQQLYVGTPVLYYQSRNADARGLGKEEGKIGQDSSTESNLDERLPVRRDGRRSVPGPRGASSLYGQPSWWGCDEDNSSTPPINNDDENRSHREQLSIEKRGGEWKRTEIEKATVTHGEFVPETAEKPTLSQPRRAWASNYHEETEEEDVSTLPLTPTMQGLRNSSSRPSSARRQWNKLESYENVVLSSILALSEKLKRSSEIAARKVLLMRDSASVQRRVFGFSSPEEQDGAVQDIPHWKTSHKETAAVIKNLRQVEHYLEVIDEIASAAIVPDIE